MAFGKFSRMIVLVFCSAIGLGSSLAKADVIAFPVNSVVPPPVLLPYQLEPQGDPFEVLVPGFDPSLGLLQAVDIEYVVFGSRVGWGVLNTPGDPYEIEISLTGTVSLSNGTEILSATDSMTVNGSTGDFGFQSFFDLFDAASLTDPAALALFTSAGDVPLTYAGAFSFALLSGNAASQNGALSTGSLGLLNVSYTFDPNGVVPISLPSSMALFIAGLLALGSMRGGIKEK